MNYDSGTKISLHLPLMLLSLAASVFFVAQIGSSNKNSETMRWQIGNLDAQIENLTQSKQQLDQLIQQRNEQVKQAQQVQQEYNNFLSEVMDLAETNTDARKVIEKWNMRRNPPAPASASPK